MASPTVVNAVSAVSNGGTNTISLPAIGPVAEADKLICWWTVNGSTATILTAPAGCTLIEGPTPAGTSLQTVFYYRDLVDGDDNLTLSLQWSASVKGGCGGVVVRGAAAGAPDAFNASADSGADTTCAAPSITPIADDCLWLQVAGTNFPTTGGATPPAGWTELLDQATTSTTPLAGIYAMWTALTGQAGVLQASVSATYGATGRDVPMSITLAPAAAGGGTTSANAGQAAATGTANNPKQTVTTSGGQAAATGVANAPQATVKAAAGVATATGTAYDAAPTSAVPVLAMAQVALAVGEAYFDAGVSESVVLTADNPIDGSGQAYDAVGGSGPDPMAGGSTGTAYDAMVVISQGATVDPLVAAAVGSAFAATVATIERRYIFRVPTTRHGRRTTPRSTPAQRGLYRHFETVGEPPAVLVTGDVVEEVYDPTFAQVAAADYAFMGGHENVVPPELVSLLEAAGYTVELAT